MRLLRPPKYLPEVIQAIYELGEKHGSNAQRIISHIEEKLKRSEPHPPPHNVSMQVRRALKAATESGEVEESAGLFRLSRVRGGGDRFKRMTSPRGARRRTRYAQTDRRRKGRSRSRRRTQLTKHYHHEEKVSKKSRTRPSSSDDNKKYDSRRSTPSVTRDDSKSLSQSLEADSDSTAQHYVPKRKSAKKQNRSDRKTYHEKKSSKRPISRKLRTKSGRRKRDCKKTAWKTSKPINNSNYRRGGHSSRRDNGPAFPSYGSVREPGRHPAQHHQPARPEYTVDPNVLHGLNPTDCLTANKPNDPKASDSGSGGECGNNTNDPDTDTGRDHTDRDYPDCGNPNCLCNLGAKNKSFSCETNSKDQTNTEG